MSRALQFTPKVRETYLRELRMTGLIGHSANAVGLTRQAVEKHREVDDSLEQDIAEALKDYCDRIEREIDRRAIEGWDQPVYQGGRMVGTIRKHSDALLIALAKRRIPEYRDTPIQITQNTTVLQVPERLAKHLEARRSLLHENEVAVVEHVPGNGKANGNGNGNGHSD